MKTLFAKLAWLPGGWTRNVTIRIDAGGMITSVGQGGPAPDDAELLGALVPGMVNTHSHAFQRVLAGRTEQAEPGHDTFWSWRERMYACVDQISTTDMATLATWLYVEMLKAGYTSAAEFHYLHNAGADVKDRNPCANSLAHIGAGAATGMRLTLLPALYMYGGFDSQPVESHQRRFVTTVEEYLALLDDLRSHDSLNLCIGLALHSLRAVSPDAMHRVLEHGGNADCPVHVHAAEQQREVDDCIAWSGKRPVEWLLDTGRVDRRWCVVHATHLLPDETRALAASDAVVGLCPTTEANLGDGLFPLADYLNAGGRIAIGSDSHVSIDPWEELRWLEYGQRLNLRERNVAASAAQPHTGTRLYTAALAGGAQALGQAVGCIAQHHHADFTVIDDSSPLLAGSTNDELFDSLVFAGGQNPVTDVMVGGNWVVRDRRHPLEEDAAGAFSEVRQRLAGGGNKKRG